ncbi:MAG: hypothetical protein QXO86_06655 [Nitrososphaerota archaeon]
MEKVQPGDMICVYQYRHYFNVYEVWGNGDLHRLDEHEEKKKYALCHVDSYKKIKAFKQRELKKNRQAETNKNQVPLSSELPTEGSSSQ